MPVNSSVTSEGHSVSRDTVRIYLYQMAALATSLVTSIVVARILGPAGKGVVDAYVLLSALIAQLATLGFGNGLFYNQSKGRVAIATGHGSIVLFSVIVGSVAAVVGWGLLPFWQSAFPNLSSWMILVAFVSAPLALYRDFWPNFMSGLNRAVTPHRVSFYVALLAVGLICGLGLLGQLTAASAVLVTVLVLGSTVALNMGISLRIDRRLNVDCSLIIDSTSYGLIIFIGTVANALHFKIDQIMINVWLGSEQLGLYTTAMRWAEFLFVLDAALGSATLYRISSSTVEDSRAFGKRLVILQLGISATAGVLLAFIAEPLVVMLYGSEFKDAAQPLIVLIPGIVFWSVSKIASTHFSYNRKLGHMIVAVAVIGAVMNAGMNVLFIRELGMGLSGAALASTLSYSAVGIFILVRFFSGR